MAEQRVRRYVLEGLTCANCAAKIEREIERETGWPGGINFSTRTVYLPPEIAPKVQEIIDRIEPGVRLVDQAALTSAEEGAASSYVEDGVPPAPPGGATVEEQGRKAQATGREASRDGDGARPLTARRAGEIAAALALVVIGILFAEALRGTPYAAAEYGVFLAAYWLSGRRVVAAAVRSLRSGGVLDENVLMTIATAGALVLRELPEAVSVMLFYSIGEACQDYAAHRSRRSIQALLDIRPAAANVRRGGKTLRVEPWSVAVGEEIVVRPGEKVPLDGEVIEGGSFVDTSALTGEPVPRRVEPGDSVLAGMVNMNDLLVVRVSRPYSESSVAKILELVEHAGARKAKTERFITRFARFYTPAVVLAALALAFLPPLLRPQEELSRWVYRALVLLVISCPCALVLSIPIGYFGGIGGAARRGILIKGANFLDALAELDTVVIDKTGTLTKGVFEVQEVAAYNGFSKEEVLEYAAHAEKFSRHPIASSILRAYAKEIDETRIRRLEEIPGHGVKALIDERIVVAGNDRMLHRENISHNDCGGAGTIVNVAVDSTLAGRIVVADELKPDARRAIEALKRLGVTRTVMLTGDRQDVARRVGEALGIDEIYAELLPEEKLSVLEKVASKRKRRSGKIAFVGDGINDAPALMRADVGIAMGALGSDASIEAADVVIMDDMPSKVAEAIAIARRTKRIVWQNIALALGVKAAFIALGAWGLAGLWEAVFADVGVSLLAVLNATRALRA